MSKGSIGKQTIEELTVTYRLDERIKYDDVNYGWKILDELYKYLEIGHVVSPKIDIILKLLVYQRILNPGSKLATVRCQEEMFGDWPITENEMYRSLSYFNKKKETLELHLHKAITRNIGRVATLVFYDVTNYYFEINVNDEDEVNEETGEVRPGMRKKGASKEKREDPIVQMGLFMDSDGIPISYQLFEGNVPDASTYCEVLNKSKHNLELRAI